MSHQDFVRFRTASPGYWTGLLIPFAIYFSHPPDKSKELRPILIILFYNTFSLIILHFFKSKRLLEHFKKITLLISFLIAIFTKEKGSIYEIFTLTALSYAFPHILFQFLRNYPKSFTFGESLIVTQTFTFYFYEAVKIVPFPYTNFSMASETQMSRFLVMAGFLLSITIGRVILFIQMPWKYRFAEEFFSLWAKCCIVSFLYKLSLEEIYFIIYWTFNFLFGTFQRRMLMLYWVICLSISIYYLLQKRSVVDQISSIDRKWFHFMVVGVFLPGILIDFNLIYFCSSGLVDLFLLIEFMRLIKFKFNGGPLGVFNVGQSIDDGVSFFRDHQDEGALILTPIYLLAGCSFSIWLIGLFKNYDILYVSSELNEFGISLALVGISTIGIGDTFASIGGMTFGKWHWSGSKKTIEGTICSILSQAIFLLSLQFLGFINFKLKTCIYQSIAILITSLIEANTDQIDNFILPITAFNVIHFLKSFYGA